MDDKLVLELRLEPSWRRNTPPVDSPRVIRMQLVLMIPRLESTQKVGRNKKVEIMMELLKHLLVLSTHRNFRLETGKLLML